MSAQVKPQTNSTILKYFDRAAYFLILALVFECAIGSSGRLISFGPASVRMVLFALTFFAALPAVLVNAKSLVRDKTMLAAGIFLIYLFASFAYGLKRGNPASFAVSDLTGLLFITLLPGILVTINTKKRLFTLTKVLILGATLLAAAILAIHYILIFFPSTDKAINDFLNGHSLGGLFFLGQFIFRIYLRSSIYNLCAVMLGLYFYFRPEHEDKEGIKIGRITSAAVIVLNLYALMLTYTRSLWFGLFFALIYVLLALRPKSKQLLKAAASTLAGFTVLITITILTSGNLAVISKGVERVSIGLASHLNITIFERNIEDWNTTVEEKRAHEEMEKADKLRTRTMNSLVTRISQKPIIGFGLGQNLDEISRKDGKAEFTYHDIAMKMGITGLILFLLPFIILTAKYFSCIRKAKSGKEEGTRDLLSLTRAFAASLFGVMMVSYFNPFISNPIGLCIFLIFAASLYNLEQSLKTQ